MRDTGAFTKLHRTQHRKIIHRRQFHKQSKEGKRDDHCYIVADVVIHIIVFLFSIFTKIGLKQNIIGHTLRPIARK